MFLLTTLLGLAAFARAAHWEVIVGGPDILKFDPPYVNANPHDTISFVFKQKNHTLTQSSFESPCSPLPYGFDTGFNQVVPPDQMDNFPTVTLTVNETSPLWYYCKQGDHCSKGMVFAINPGDKFPEFEKAALATAKPSGSQPVAPTASWPAESTGVVTVTETLTDPNGHVWTTTYGSYPGSPAPTAPGPVDHPVIVGGPNIFVFDPDHVVAQPHDTITFIFKQKNHTVTQSTFGSPCSPFAGGFDSGFMPVADSVTSDFPTYRITVNDTQPIWAYCRQGDHCPVRGMVFSVNAVASGPNNHDAFKARATSSPSGSGAPQQTGSQAGGNNGAMVSTSVGSASMVLVMGFSALAMFWL